MDFTREPIIETVITPKEGWKLVLRSSKGGAQDEYFVDAVEIVRFGSSQFYRSLERPKCFILPVSDFEVLEVREARMVIKNVGIDRSIKIGGGKESSKKEPAAKEEAPSKEKSETRGRRTRRTYRRRRGKEDVQGENEEGSQENVAEGETPPPTPTLIAPPSTLISDNLSKYRDDDKYKQAFYDPAEQPESSETPEKAEAPEAPAKSPESFDEGDDILFKSTQDEAPAQSNEEEVVTNNESQES